MSRQFKGRDHSVRALPAVAKNATPVVITAQHRLIHEAQPEDLFPAVSSLCDATKFVLADPPFAAASVAAFFRVTA